MQVVLIVSGNLSFLNWLTLIPAIMCCDDKSLCWLFSSATRHRVIDLQQYWKNTKTWPLSKQQSPIHVIHVLEASSTGRLLRSSGVISGTGWADSVPEYPSGPESPLLTTDHEQLIRLTQNCQHLWSLWQVDHISMNGYIRGLLHSPTMLF